MHYHHEKSYLVVVTSDVVLYKFRISKEGKMKQERKVKLSIRGDGSELVCTWAGNGLLAAANGENLVRLWHLETDDNYVLTCNDPQHRLTVKDRVTCLSFNPRKRVLAGGTKEGRVIMWRFVRSLSYVEDADFEAASEDWDVIPGVGVNSNYADKGVVSLRWYDGAKDGLIAASTGVSVSILSETVLHCKTVGDTSVIQLSSERLVTQCGGDNASQVAVTTTIRIKGVDVSAEHVVVWNGKQVEVRAVGGETVKYVSTFDSAARSIAIHKQQLFLFVGNRIEFTNFQGVVKKALTFTDTEGKPAHMSVWKDHLGT
jgi:intraflagellar transport protein 140